MDVHASLRVCLCLCAVFLLDVWVGRRESDGERERERERGNNIELLQLIRNCHVQTQKKRNEIASVKLIIRENIMPQMSLNRPRVV